MLTVKNTLRDQTIQANENWWESIQKQMSRDPKKRNPRLFHKDGSPVWVLEGEEPGTVAVAEKKSQRVKDVEAKGNPAVTTTTGLTDEVIEKFIPLCLDQAAIDRVKSKLSPEQLEKFSGKLLAQAETFKKAIEKAKNADNFIKEAETKRVEVQRSTPKQTAISLPAQPKLQEKKTTKPQPKKTK